MEGYMYILRCSNGLYYVGSTINLKERLWQHQNRLGAKYTQLHYPVELVYFEKCKDIMIAFSREKQVKCWSRKKKEALIYGQFKKLPELSECQNETHSKNYKPKEADKEDKE